MNLKDVSTFLKIIFIQKEILYYKGFIYFFKIKYYNHINIKLLAEISGCDILNIRQVFIEISNNYDSQLRVKRNIVLLDKMLQNIFF